MMTDSPSFAAMTVNERLWEAGLMDNYEAAKARGDLVEINSILAKVELRQDENGMNGSIDADDR